MNEEEIPDQIKALVDKRAGKVHSNGGSVMSTLAEALTMYEKALRAKIAYDIRAELVCCKVYDWLAPQRAEIDTQKPGWEEAHSRFVDAMSGHEICYWGEASARIAEEDPHV